MYSDIGQKSNTMIFSDRPADVNALLAQASTVVQSLSGPRPTNAPSSSSSNSSGNSYGSSAPPASQ